jgi:putative FmdB family regulatory protein
MPIYEYICRDCRHGFETLVSADRPPSCPSCHGRQLDKQHSVFAVSAKSNSAAPASGSCGTCGDPRGPGACGMN